jgi:polyisoprenoid-binding protein YceI
MRLELLPDTRVLVDLRATGLLRAVGHDPTLVARPEATAVELDGETASVSLRFPVRDIEPPRDISESDRDKMRENMLSRDVLDASRFPAIEVRARYAGTREGGTLDGDLVVRGRPNPFSMPVRVAKEGEVLVATGTWEGTLNGLGIKPFKALLGALKLKDWIRLRLEARLR